MSCGSRSGEWMDSAVRGNLGNIDFKVDIDC